MRGSQGLEPVELVDVLHPAELGAGQAAGRECPLGGRQRLDERLDRRDGGPAAESLHDVEHQQGGEDGLVHRRSLVDDLLVDVGVDVRLDIHQTRA
jgi:hypothetical protein